MSDCIFCAIAKGEIPKEFEYKDDKVLVFKDLHPVRPVHLLIVPREHIDDFYNVQNDEIYIAIKNVIKRMIEKYKLMDKGYRIGVNGGGAQIINHLHFHLISPVKSTESVVAVEKRLKDF